MRKSFFLLLALFVLNFSTIAYADETENTEISVQSELPEGIAPLPDFVAAE